MPMLLRLARLWALCAGLAAGTLPASAPAQDGFTLPPELLQGWRRQAGDSITFCIDPGSATAQFDRAVARAIADTLLLEVRFADLPSGFPIDAQGFWDEFLLVLTNECQAALGMALISTGYPEWLTVTRPYAGIGSVLVVTDPDYGSLLDVPRDRILGTQILSMAESRLISYMAQLPPEQRWRRLPYGDSALMLRRLQDGTLGAVLMWRPTLTQQVGTDPAAQGLHVRPTDPVEVPDVQLGGVLLVRDAFLRGALDEAIATLTADGTIARLLAESGLEG